MAEGLDVLGTISPKIGRRRQSEWDDHSEAYPESWKGPDLTDVSCSATYTIDSVRYSFAMSCSDGTSSMGGEALIDNHPAQARVTAEGCSRPDLLDLSFSSRPIAASPLNKAGTAMEFQKESALVFNIPKTYWYGTAKPGCCYRNLYPYEVRLVEKTDGEVASEQVAVGWPAEHPKAVVDVDPLEYSLTIGDADADWRFVATLVIVGFTRTPHPVNAQNITDQYREEAILEEGYHIKQYVTRQVVEMEVDQ